MSAPRLCLAAVLLSMFVASGAVAQSTSPKPTSPTTKKPTPKPTTKPATDDKTTKQEGGYPEIVKKELYAEVDVRGKEAPKFKVEKWLTDEPDRKGKTVIIDFWATWCGPCRKLMPELSKWQKTFKDDLVVIGVSDEKADKVSEFLKTNKVGYAIATDTQATMSKTLRVKGIPHVLVITSDGIVRWQGLTAGETDQLTEAKLKQIIDADKAARAKKDATKETKPATTDKKPATDKPATTTTPTTPPKK